MEQVLYEVLLKHIPEEASMNLAEELLNACGKAGMLPPTIKGGPGFLSDEYGMANEWDDE